MAKLLVHIHLDPENPTKAIMADGNLYACKGRGSDLKESGDLPCLPFPEL